MVIEWGTVGVLVLDIPGDRTGSAGLRGGVLQVLRILQKCIYSHSSAWGRIEAIQSVQRVSPYSLGRSGMSGPIV